MHYLESISHSRFLRIDYATHAVWIEKHRSIETAWRKTTEAFLAGVIQRQHELMAFDMEKRFEVFMGRSKRLLQLIPHRDIASYLRIDPTNFSKLLSKYNT